MALGMQRAGWLGAISAWVGFTLPSALALIALAYGMASFSALAASGAVQGLKVVAVAVVAQAVWGMAGSLCPDRPRAALAVLAALLALALPSAVGQVGAIAVWGLIGWRLLRLPHQEPVPHAGYGVSRRTGRGLLALFLVLLLGLLLLQWLTPSPMLAQIEAFYRAGAPVRWCSVGATWCCRCCKRRWFRRGGSATPNSWRATALHRRCPGPSSPSRPTSVR